MPKPQQGDCAARLAVDSPEYFVVVALRKLHKKAGNYGFIDIEDLKSELDEKTRHILNDPENGTLDRLERMQIVELNLVNDLQFKIHPDHWIPFNEF